MRTRPLLGLPLALALLTLAGLPPAVLGLVAKIVALRPVAADGTWWLAVVAALNVALGIAVYVRWVAVLLQTPDPAPVGVAAGSTGDGGDGDGDADERADREGDDAQEGAARPRVPVREVVLVAALTAVVVVGSITPFGVL